MQLQVDLKAQKETRNFGLKNFAGEYWRMEI